MCRKPKSSSSSARHSHGSVRTMLNYWQDGKMKLCGKKLRKRERHHIRPMEDGTVSAPPDALGSALAT